MEDYSDLSKALQTFTSIRELNLSFDSNEMGGDCLKILTNSYQEYEYLEKLRMNLNRNDIGPDALCSLIQGLEHLGMLSQVYIQAKKNIRRIDEKDMVRDALLKLMIKNKKIDL